MYQQNESWNVNGTDRSILFAFAFRSCRTEQQFHVPKWDLSCCLLYMKMVIKPKQCTCSTEMTFRASTLHAHVYTSYIYTCTVEVQKKFYVPFAYRFYYHLRFHYRCNYRARALAVRFPLFFFSVSGGSGGGYAASPCLRAGSVELRLEAGDCDVGLQSGAPALTKLFVGGGETAEHRPVDG